MNPRQAYFVPSRFSTYGEADVATVEAEAAPKPLPWDAIVGGASALLGMGDPRDEVTKYENRLRDLQYGTPAEKTAAMLASGALTIPGAIEKTENKLQESLEQAYQTETRDKLMTALLITGVVAGGMGVLWLGAKGDPGGTEEPRQEEEDDDEEDVAGVLGRETETRLHLGRSR